MNTDKIVRLLIFIGVLFLVGCQGRDSQPQHPSIPGQVTDSRLERTSGTFVYPRDMEFTEEVNVTQPPPVHVFAPGTPPTIKVASWNIENLGHRQRGRRALQYQRMASMINQFDVIVIEEVMNPKGAQLLANSVLGLNANRNWGFLYSKKQGKPGTHTNSKESIMYFWKRSKISMLRHGSYVNAQMTEMDRSPYWAHFRTRAVGNNAFDFILIGLHTKPSEVGEITYLGGMYSNLKTRFSQAPTNTGSSVRQDIHESIETDIIIAGDFNAGIQPNGVTNEPRDREFSRLFGANNNRPPGLNKAIHQQRTMRSGTRSNDNLMWDQPTEEDFSGNRNVVTFTDQYVSDHYPVFATFHWSSDQSD